MCLTGGLLRGMVILLLGVLLCIIGEVCEWCRVSLVFNRCVDLFLGSKLSVVSCCNGCAVVNSKISHFLVLYFLVIVVAAGVFYLILGASCFLGVSSAVIVVLQLLW